MLSKSTVSSLLQISRDLIYRGRFRCIARRIGLNKVLSVPYWRLVYYLSGGSITHSINNQTIKFEVNSFSEFMRLQNFVNEKEVIEEVLCSIKPTDYFYDIGANVGSYTCFAASEVGKNRTVAFEPEANNLRSLKSNLELNDLDAKVAKAALSDSSGTTELALAGDQPGEGKHAIATDESRETIVVPMWTGDDYIQSHEVEPPTVIKIDVEGAEMDVLRGLSETLQNHCRLIYIEVHPEKIQQFGSTVPEVTAFLECAGFEVSKLAERGDEFFLRASR